MTAYNPNYFSTQPTGGAVPANQIMMAAQQAPHMLAAGQPMQPMMVPQQQPMMMVPAGQQMMYAPMSAPMQPQQQVQQQMMKPADKTKPKLVHGQEGSKQFTVVGVANPHLLEVEAPNLSWQMMKAGTASGKDYLYSYDPAKQIHNVSVKYDKEHVEGSPFQLMPKEMKNQVVTAKNVADVKDAHKHVFVSINPQDSHHLIARNVPDVDKLDFKTDMGFKLLTDPADAQTFHLKLKSMGKVHPLDVTYNDKLVPNGQFEFVPKAMKEKHEYNQKKKQMEARVQHAHQEYMQTVQEMDKLALNAPVEEPAQTPEAVVTRTREPASREVVHNEALKSHIIAHHVAPKADEVATKAHEMAAATAQVNARTPHMTQAGNGNYGPVVMSSPQQAMPQAQPQPMMAAPQGMMMAPQPMYSNGTMGPAMYQMVPQQQMMMQGQQPRMYKQQ